ncbi:MAG: hypothetical protein KGI25_03530 [Thaumarchaeota archaeon]|nr:hypothetical protein [Nitrososphaerota archaeon]
MNRQHALHNEYDSHIHFSANKVLERRLEYLVNKIKDTDGDKSSLQHMKSECQAIRYALFCMDFCKEDYLKHRKNGEVQIKNDETGEVSWDKEL